MKKLLLVFLIIWSPFLLSAQEFTAGAVTYRVEPVVEGLKVPWSMAWLPDGSMLITERDGRLLRLTEGNLSEIKGLPEVHASGQGGLMEVMLHPDYANNGWIYLTYSFREGGSGGNTALIRGKIRDGEWINQETLFKSTPNAGTRHHYGGRIVFDDQNHIFLSLGERGTRENAQDLGVTAGSIVRLQDDGGIPGDNPFTGDNNVHPAIWSYGHRNPQGIAFNPVTGSLFNTEHGPQGGDELNHVQAGANYGWPVITYGKNYDGTTITNERSRAGMEQPVHYWVPSIAPGSLMFVTSDRYPAWKGDALVGSLKFNYLERVDMNGDKASGTEKLLPDFGRIRDVREGPDGYIYISAEGKGIYKLIVN